jgi:LPXTG-site transpeptidase (sortase) family protein
LGIVVLGIVGAAAGVWLVGRAPGQQAGLTPPPATGSAPGFTPPAKRNTRQQMPRPVRITIPAIGVSAPVVPLGLNADGTLQVPVDIRKTGWFTKGPEPGERGAAVIVGHVDSRSGPGVFYRLRDLRVGEVINIRLRDRSAVRYVVDSMLRVAKSHFPTKLVYARTAKPTLRLITCAGKLNPATGHHLDNYIVFASIIA